MTGCAVALATMLSPAGARAQVAASVGLQSQYQHRGYSLSAREPVAVLDLAYDHPSGVYLNGSAAAAIGEDGNPVLVALIGNLGYARRVAGETAVDVGVSSLRYTTPYGARRSEGYTEVYAGLTGPVLSSHLYYSPNYYSPEVSTLYWEVDGVIAAADDVKLGAHVGMLHYLKRPMAYYVHETNFDWRLSASRQFGHLNLYAALVGGGPDKDYYKQGLHDRTTAMAGASWTF